MVDTNIIVSYAEDQTPGLRDYIDHASEFGKRFFVTPRIRAQYKRDSLPAPFYLCEVGANTERLVSSAYPVFLKKFGVNTSKFVIELSWLLESGQCLAPTDGTQPSNDAKNSCIVALTTNTALVRRFLRTRHFRENFASLVSDCGLGRMADVRLVVSEDGSFADFSAREDDPDPLPWAPIE